MQHCLNTLSTHDLCSNTRWQHSRRRLDILLDQTIPTGLSTSPSCCWTPSWQAFPVEAVTEGGTVLRGLGIYHCSKVCHTEFPTSHTQVLCATRATSPQIRKVSTVCTCVDFICTRWQLVQRADNRLLTRTKIWKTSPWSLQHKAALFHFHGSFNSTHSGGSLKTWNAFKWSTIWKVVKAVNNFKSACSQTT